MTAQQSGIVNSVMKEDGAPPYAVVIDAALGDDAAFTYIPQKTTFVNAGLLKNNPHTFANVVRHEVAHLRGAQHGDGSAVMNYKVTKDLNGNIIDDGFFLLGPRG